MKKNIKNINFTNYANIDGSIVKCDIMKKYEEDSTALVKAYYSEYHFEYKYVMQDQILTREEGELLLSKIDRHHGIYVRTLNVGPDDSNDWEFIKIKDRVLKVHIYSVFF